MKKEPELVHINENELWGGLTDPEEHRAAVGARWCDHPSRTFESFGDRQTVVGEKKVAERLLKWLYSRATLNKIKRNTSFARSTDDRNCWATRLPLGKKGDIFVTLSVRCAGEYCYVQAYAD